MPALKILELSFLTNGASGMSAWNLLANIPKLPNLTELELQGCNMSFRDMTRFVLNQIDTLEILHLSILSLHEGSRRHMRISAQSLSVSPRTTFNSQCDADCL